MPWLLHIKDKTMVRSKSYIEFHKNFFIKLHKKLHCEEKIKKKRGERMFCPPHYIPHKLPIGKKVCNEHCHYHKAKWRMFHHKTFCKILRCPHYKRMMEEYNSRNK